MDGGVADTQPAITQAEAVRDGDRQTARGKL